MRARLNKAATHQECSTKAPGAVHQLCHTTQPLRMGFRARELTQRVAVVPVWSR